MSLLSTPEPEMEPAERTLAEFLTMRLQQIDKGRTVMNNRIDNITEEQENLKVRAEEFSRMVEEESETLAESGDVETVPTSAEDWYVDTASEIQEETKKIGSRLEGAKKVIDQINGMQEVYVNVAQAVDSGELSLVEAKEMIEQAEQKCDWLSNNHEYDLSVLDAEASA